MKIKNIEDLVNTFFVDSVKPTPLQMDLLKQLEKSAIEDSRLIVSGYRSGRWYVKRVWDRYMDYIMENGESIEIPIIVDEWKDVIGSNGTN